jgi:hypothetical protein
LIGIALLLWALALVGTIVVLFGIARVWIAIDGQLFMRWWRLRSWWRSAFDPPPQPLILPELPIQPEPEPVDISPYRTEHMHVIGGSGAGKTTFLEHRILADLNDDSEPAVVVVDSQAELIRKLSHLQPFSWDHSDDRYLDQRIIVIDPRDEPAMNPFAIHRKRLDTYDEHTRYQVEQGIIQSFDYLFSSVLGADLTTRQDVLFRNTARLMVSLPKTMGRNATMLDLLAIMEDPTPYKPVIDTLSPIAQIFFHAAFFDPVSSRAYRPTREQVTYRLYALLEDPVLVRIFSAETNELDLFSRLNTSYVILVDTAKDYLRDASPIFGSIFICNLLQAIQERANARYRQRCHVYIDEAQEYFNQAGDAIDELLTQARKQEVGLCFAHQFRGQCSPQLWASLMANTSIKLASGVSAADAGTLSSEFRCETKDLLSVPRYTWACFIKGRDNKPVLVDDGPSPLDDLPRMTKDEYDEFRGMNRVRIRPPRKKQAEAKSQPPAAADVETIRPDPEHTPPSEPVADASEASTDWRPGVD